MALPSSADQCDAKSTEKRLESTRWAGRSVVVGDELGGGGFRGGGGAGGGGVYV